jgi:hypothetical protein
MSTSEQHVQQANNNVKMDNRWARIWLDWRTCIFENSAAVPIDQSLERYRVTLNLPRPAWLLCLVLKNTWWLSLQEDQNQSFITYLYTYYTHLTSSIAAFSSVYQSMEEASKKLALSSLHVSRKGRSDRVTSVSFPKAGAIVVSNFWLFSRLLSCVLAFPVSHFSGLGWLHNSFLFSHETVTFGVQDPGLWCMA